MRCPEPRESLSRQPQPRRTRRPAHNSRRSSIKRSRAMLQRTVPVSSNTTSARTTVANSTIRRRIEMGFKSFQTVQWGGWFLALAAVMACNGLLGQVTPEGPLLFRIVLAHSSVCVADRHLELESELRNISGHPVSLSPAGITAQVSFTNRACSLDDGFRSNTISTDPAPGWKSDKFVTLAPGESYRQTLRLEL